MTLFWKKKYLHPTEWSRLLTHVLFHCWSRADLPIFWPIFRLTAYQCHAVVMVICLWLSRLIFDFLLKSCPLSSFFFYLGHQSERRGSRHGEYQVADWGCHSGPGGPWLPDVLVHWCQQQDLSLGFVRVCRRGQTVRRRLLSRVLSLTRACHSYCLFLYSSLSVHCWCWCLMTLPILWGHLSCHILHLN